MTYYKFPVQSNNSRRLRRSSTANVALAADATQLQHRSAAPMVAHLSTALSSLEPSALDPEPLLSWVDREVLLRQQAIAQAKNGQAEAAIHLFSLLIHHNPHSAGNYNNRGLLYFQLGQYEQALADYDAALQLTPTLAKVFNNRGNCFAALGELEAAIADYETAIDLDPTDVRTYLNQGITYRELNLFNPAIECFDLALQFSTFLNLSDPVSTVPAALEGHIYAERGRTYHYLGDWNVAIADYRRALARLPIGETLGNSRRLRQQVQSWMDELLEP
jgi:tetratricopeptide (TPR) repeat protein